jgi:transposase-like protein
MARYKGTNPIYYDLDNSIYEFETDNFIYYFSSILYLDKFKSQRDLKNSEFIVKQSSRLNINMDITDLADIIHYRDRETRGFRIYDKRKGKYIKCLSNLKFVGEIKIQNN